MFSELESRNEQGMLRFIYLSYSRYIFMILLPILVLLYVYGPSFIGLWIGPEYAQRGETTLYLLTTTVLIESAQPLLWRFFVGVGRLNILVKVSATSSLLVVLLGIVLVRTQGIAGVALSVLVGAILGQVIYVGHACRYLGISVGSFFVQVHLRPLLVAATMAVAAVLLAMGLGTDDYASILAGALVAMALYAMLALPLALRAKERALLLRKVSAILQRGRPVTHEGG
jgi:O-antigen/teichoic acid export membrane protein